MQDLCIIGLFLSGSNTCYIKFAAVRSPASDNDVIFAANNFDRSSTQRCTALRFTG